ncbi:hypothetical protein EDD85DRAFT_784245 [Armillaria nabsnona]|nr:hypothetical protein EDD85DRAFT_784245 [Armillaria nabsnona]
MPLAAQIKEKPHNTTNTKMKSMNSKPVPKPATKPAIQAAPQARSQKRQFQVISDSGGPDSEDDIAPVSKKGRQGNRQSSEKVQKLGKSKKLGAQKTPPSPPPLASDSDDVEEDNTEEDMDVDVGSGNDVDGMAGGRGRKMKHGEKAILTQLEIKTARKQKCYKVLQQIASDDGEIPAKRKANLEECIKILSDAHKWGKLMPCAINLWVDPEDVLLEGIKHSLSSDSPSEKGPNIHAYEALTSLWSIDLSADLEYFVDADDGISKISMAVHKGFKAGCQEDTHKIRDAILKIIVKDPRKEALSLPIPVIKPAQGFNYFETAHLLCSQNFLEMFDRNDNWRQQLCEGKMRITHWELPSFLFDQSKISLDDDLAGCMEGYVLVRTVKHLFLSDGIPGKTKGPTRSPIAKIYKIKAITGHIIAYGACQAHYALSSVDGWTCRDGKFNLVKLYDTIVDMYEDFPEDPWAVQSLAWWNKEIFGNSAGADNDEDEDEMVPLPASMVARMAEAQQQRQEIHKAARATADVGDLLLNGGFPLTDDV